MGNGPYGLRFIEPYIHYQTVPVDMVTVFHGKNKPCPNVIVVDSEGCEIEVEIRRPNENNIQILTNVPIIFTVYIY